VSAVHGAQQSLARRLQRLGWATSVFSSPEQALSQLQGMPAVLGRPSLVIAAQSPLVTVDAVQALRAELPRYAQTVVATAGVAAPITVDGVDYRSWPFSPRELEEMTQRMLDTTASFARETMPSAFDPEHRPKVLIVDDNAVNLLVAAGLMQVAGFDVRTAESGEEAIARCHEEAPDLVLMDVHMPGMDGLQATRYLRAFQQSGALPPFLIVAATADAIDIGQPACLEAGMDGYLSKPLTLQAIQREIRRILPGVRFAVTLP
jgi:CheY-like chemotaxis protein